MRHNCGCCGCCLTRACSIAATGAVDGCHHCGTRRSKQVCPPCCVLRHSSDACAVGWRPHAAHRAAGARRSERADVLRAVRQLQQQAGRHCAQEQGAGRLMAAHQVLSLPGDCSLPGRALWFGRAAPLLACLHVTRFVFPLLSAPAGPARHHAVVRHPPSSRLASSDIGAAASSRVATIARGHFVDDF